MKKDSEYSEFSAFTLSPQTYYSKTKSYIKDSGYFIKQNLKVTTDSRGCNLAYSRCSRPLFFTQGWFDCP